MFKSFDAQKIELENLQNEQVQIKKDYWINIFKSLKTIIIILKLTTDYLSQRIIPLFMELYFNPKSAFQQLISLHLPRNQLENISSQQYLIQQPCNVELMQRIFLLTLQNYRLTHQLQIKSIQSQQTARRNISDHQQRQLQKVSKYRVNQTRVMAKILQVQSNLTDILNFKHQKIEQLQKMLIAKHKQLSEKQQKYRKLEKQHKMLQQQYRNQISELKATNLFSNSKCKEQQRNFVNKINIKYNQYENRLIEKDKELTRAYAKIKQFQQFSSQKQEQIEKSNQVRQQLRNKLNTEIRKLKQQSFAFKKQIEQLNQRNQQISIQKKSLENQLQTLSRKYQASLKQCGIIDKTVKNQVKALQKQKSQRQQQIKQFEIKIKMMIEENLKQNQQLKKVTSQRQQILAQSQKLKGQIKLCKENSYTDKNIELTLQVNKCKSMQAKIQMLQIQIQKLTKERDICVQNWNQLLNQTAKQRQMIYYLQDQSKKELRRETQGTVQLQQKILALEKEIQMRNRSSDRNFQIGRSFQVKIGQQKVNSNFKKTTAELVDIRKLLRDSIKDQNNIRNYPETTNQKRNQANKYINSQVKILSYCEDCSPSLNSKNQTRRQYKSVLNTHRSVQSLDSKPLNSPHERFYTEEPVQMQLTNLLYSKQKFVKQNLKIKDLSVEMKKINELKYLQTRKALQSIRSKSLHYSYSKPQKDQVFWDKNVQAKIKKSDDLIKIQQGLAEQSRKLKEYRIEAQRQQQVPEYARWQTPGYARYLSFNLKTQESVERNASDQRYKNLNRQFSRLNYTQTFMKHLKGKGNDLGQSDTLKRLKLNHSLQIRRDLSKDKMKIKQKVEAKRNNLKIVDSCQSDEVFANKTNKQNILLVKTVNDKAYKHIIQSRQKMNSIKLMTEINSKQPWNKQNKEAKKIKQNETGLNISKSLKQKYQISDSIKQMKLKWDLT